MKTSWHVISPEFPPTIGGVGDYSNSAAESLRLLGANVFVWHPHRPPLEGGFSPLALLRLSSALDASKKPIRLFVQWVPHGYGYKAMNLFFAAWLLWRARRGDHIDLMIHEPFLPYRPGALKQNFAALTQRVMMQMALRASGRVWIAIERWRSTIAPYLDSAKQVECLPVPSNVLPTSSSPADLEKLFGNSEPVIGHFGTYSPYTKELLKATLQSLGSACNVLLLGKGSDAVAASYGQARIRGMGQQDAQELSRAIAACSLLLQPYEDGVSSRRGSTMAALCHGKAALSTDGVSTEDYWRSSGAIWLTQCGEIAAMGARLADGVRLLLSNPAQVREMESQAKALYEERFAIEVTMRKLFDSRMANS